ncbi:Stomatin-like protein [Drosera capensis]
MSMTRLNSTSKKLRSLSTLSSSLCSSHRALSSSSSSSFSLILKESSRLANSFSSPSPPALLSQCVRGMFSGAGRRFDERERYQRRTAVNWGVRVVPEQEAHVIERFGKFHKILDSGIHLLIPLIDRIAYIHSLKEEVFEVSSQSAVTVDNVSLQIDGVLYVKVVDPRKASYGVDDPIFAVIQHAQAIMRSAIGKMTLDETFKERSTLNAIIVEAINEAASNWGLVCHRYDILDITPPPGVRVTMELPAEAERKKRAQIVEAEGKREAMIKASEGERQAVILASEAAKLDQVNRAEGEAAATRIRAVATAEAFIALGKALQGRAGQEAASLKIAEEYVQAFSKLAQESTVVLLPSSLSDPSSMVTQALTLYKKLVAEPGKGSHESDEKPKLIESVAKDASSRETKDDDPLISEVADKNIYQKPVFSLQSPRRDE